MRMVGAVMLGTIVLQALLAGAFALGYLWLDDWQWGLLFAGLLLLLLLLPWLGQIRVVFDSEGPKGAVRIGWWGRANFRVEGEKTRVVVRIIGIPIRRTIDETSKRKKKPAKKDPPPEAQPGARAEPVEEKRSPKGWLERVRSLKLPDAQMVEGFSRVAASALGASNEFIWGADEIRLLVSDPAQSEVPDRTLEQAVGSRAVGPVHLIVSKAGERRRVRALYQIGLLRAVLAAVQVAIDGRAVSLARLVAKKSDERGADDLESIDQKLIDEIKQQQEGEQ